MRRYFWTIGVVAAIVMCVAVGAHSATINIPPNFGVVDVTQSPYNADNTGATDATAAIQQALTDNKRVVVIYFPNGTYKVTNTLRCANHPEDSDNHGPLLVGQNRQQTVIRLADNTFTDAGNARPVLFTGDGVAQNFEKAVYNMTVSVGRGNPGANGIYFYANNTGLISEVDIISEDGQGVKGLDLGYGEQGPCGAKSVYVKGFQYGVYADALNGVACVQITVEGQSVAGVYNANRYLWFDSLTSINTVPAVINHGDFALVNSRLKGGSSSNTAVENNGMMFARDIVAEGYGRAISGGGAPSGTSVEEYSSAGYHRLWNESPERSMDLPIKYTSDVPWEEDMSKWANVEHYKGGLGQPQRSDREAIQAAIDDDSKTVVFIPCCRQWDLDDTVYIRGNTQRLVGGWGSFRGVGVLVVTDELTAPSFGINWIGGTSIVNRSSKKVVTQTQNCRVYGQGSGELYLFDQCRGVRVMNPSQRVWAWQFNAEGGPMTEAESDHSFSLRMDAGVAYIFGWKDEGNGIATVAHGGVAEVVGFMQYTAADASHPVEMIVRDAAFSVALHSELCWNCGGGLGYSTLIEEERSGVVRRFTDGDNGGSDTYGVFTAYRPGDLDQVRAARPDQVHERQSFGQTSPIGCTSGGVLKVKLDSEFGARGTIRLMNCAGQVVLSRPLGATAERHVTIRGLQAGAYVLQLKDAAGKSSEKVVVVR